MKRDRWTLFEWFVRYVMVGAFVGGAVGECFGDVAIGDRIGGCLGIVIGVIQIARGAVNVAEKSGA